MARCPVCGEALRWEELIEQMLELENFGRLLTDKQAFISAFEGFVFTCPHCGQKFYGRYLELKELEKVFELLNDFKGGIDYENKKVRLKLTNLLALNMMLEEWDRKVKHR
ncbi:MAG TPA: hypothetical protein EYH24_00370 [Thermococcus paralvinellae]|uniref:Uncharacterized protein n=1 Tax=Thermococcus paralvinellae TaxID=582419 RepID=A0A832Z8C5_9EURY|nr:hypothetical protein [Thermococcus paralvinellae]HIP88450.1 hypothetical protein [Thermococcus paralvinellae]